MKSKDMRFDRSTPLVFRSKTDRIVGLSPKYDMGLSSEARTVQKSDSRSGQGSEGEARG